MIRTLLIPNRGEIAARICRTCRSLGITSVVAASAVDRASAGARAADRVVTIGPAPASYLDGAAVLDAARRVGADALHPGYGFLSEQAAFAEAVVAAGLTWVGPPPEAMRLLGDKATARRLARSHGVPVLPGCEDDDDDALCTAAVNIGFPLLVKAVAGGGGRGIRRVDRAADLPDALGAARREALSSFGSAGVLIERLVPSPRHVEVQVFGDRFGTVVHLGERECSIQRRNQKIVEEAPAPGVSPALRARLGEAAVNLTRAAGYHSAGTVEFLLEPDGSFWFLEVNTRLQVEHPVTEQVHGVDLVAWQLAVAEGRPLPPVPAARGHAIEVRVCAEDSLRDGLPATGTALRVELPTEEGIRVDAGLAGGDAVTPHYDSLIAKVIAWGPDREAAVRRLRRAVTRAWVPGLATNLPLLRQILHDDELVTGVRDTGFLTRRGLPVAPPLGLEDGARVATVFAWLCRRAADPRPTLAGFRIEGAAWQADTWRTGSESVIVRWRSRADGLDVEVAGRTSRVEASLRPDGLWWMSDGLGGFVRVATSAGRPPVDGDTVYVHHGDAESMVTLVPRFPPPTAAAADPGTLVAPTPGTVVAVRVTVGDAVSRGDVLVVLESMKMEQTVRAPQDGVVASVRVAVGVAVGQGDVLVRLA